MRRFTVGLVLEVRVHVVEPCRQNSARSSALMIGSTVRATHCVQYRNCGLSSSGHAEHLGEDLDRQRVREIGDEIELDAAGAVHRRAAGRGCRSTRSVDLLTQLLDLAWRGTARPSACGSGRGRGRRAGTIVCDGSRLLRESGELDDRERVRAWRCGCRSTSPGRAAACPRRRTGSPPNPASSSDECTGSVVAQACVLLVRRRRRSPRTSGSNVTASAGSAYDSVR